MAYDREAPGRFSATEAAFTGFRLLAREPATVAVWAVMVVAVHLVVLVVMKLTVGDAMAQAAAQRQAGVHVAPAESLALLGRLVPFEALALLAGLGVYALIAPAVNRAVRGEGRGVPGRLGLGASEGRQMLLFVALAALFLMTFVASVLAAGVLGGLVMAVLHAARAPGPQLLGVVTAALAMAAMLALSVRLSLASPLTFDRGRVEVSGSWTLTRGLFWPLLGAYVLTVLFQLILVLASTVLFTALAAVVGGGLSGAGALLKRDPFDLSPLGLVRQVVTAVINTAGLTLLLAAPVGAFTQLKALGRIPPASTPPGAATTPGSDLPRFGR